MSGRAATDVVIPGRHALSVGNPGTEVPPGWAWLPLGQLAAMGTGHTPSRSVPAYWDGNIPWMGIRDARANHGGKIYTTNKTISQDGLENSAARLLPAGTVALSRTASVGYVVQLGREMATSQDFVTWTCGPDLDPRYLMHAIQAEGDDICAFGEGSTHTTIYFPELKALHIKAPPLSEQRRVVAQIDRLLNKSRYALKDIIAVNNYSMRLRQDYLNKIYEEVSLSCNKKKSLGDIALEIKNGLSKKPSMTPHGMRILRISAVRPLSVNTIDYRFYPPEEAISVDKIIKNGDLLFTRYNGNPDLTGVCGVVKDVEEPTTYPDKLIRVRFPDNVCPYFVSIIASSKQSRNFLSDRIKSVAGQHGISGKDLKNLPVPLPSFHKQREIVDRVEKVFLSLGGLLTAAASSQKQLQKLDQAILAKAFRGELVPQDPNDEPASVLLDRIRAERAAAGPAPKRGRRPRTAAGA